MAGFSMERDAQRLDYRLMAGGPVRSILDRELVETTAGWLQRHGYDVVTVDASWLIPAHMFRDLGSALGYVCHDRWECLDEGLGERVREARARSAELAIVLTDFEVFARACPEPASTLLGLIAGTAWRAALFGHRVICLVHGRRDVIPRYPTMVLPWRETIPPADCG
ncbi:hypothetical protein [Nocardia niigatensis]|uniref:hypothetical protein n=1 Tax=Nocardia niigatensis TaxID=209249 RepID=UPI0005951DC2|nr:hypothetical protein [Nocardia niigatensis]